MVQQPDQFSRVRSNPQNGSEIGELTFEDVAALGNTLGLDDESIRHRQLLTRDLTPNLARISEADPFSEMETLQIQSRVAASRSVAEEHNDYLKWVPPRVDIDSVIKSNFKEFYYTQYKSQKNTPMPTEVELTHFQNQEFYMPDSEEAKKSSQKSSLNNARQIEPETVSVDDMINLKTFHMEDLTLRLGSQ